MRKAWQSLAVVAATPFAASLLFLAIGDLWSLVPWPNKLIALPAYAQAFPYSPQVWAYGGVASLITLLVAFLLLRIIFLTGRVRTAPRADKPVYGRTEWAGRIQMRDNKISARKRPF